MNEYEQQFYDSLSDEEKEAVAVLAKENENKFMSQALLDYKQVKDSSQSRLYEAYKKEMEALKGPYNFPSDKQVAKIVSKYQKLGLTRFD